MPRARARANTGAAQSAAAAAQKNAKKASPMKKASAHHTAEEDQTEELIFPDGVVAGEWKKWLHMVMAFPS